jgi:hypothetical protein
MTQSPEARHCASTRQNRRDDSIRHVPGGSTLAPTVVQVRRSAGHAHRAGRQGSPAAGGCKATTLCMVNAGPPRRCRRFQAQIRSETLDSAYEQFVSGKLSALAGLKPRLLSDLEKLPGARILDGRFTSDMANERRRKKLPGARILDGRFTSVQQAIGTSRKNPAGAAFLRDFVERRRA